VGTSRVRSSLPVTAAEIRAWRYSWGLSNWVVIMPTVASICPSTPLYPERASPASTVANAGMPVCMVWR
jgi:hypothetical protein